VITTSTRPPSHGALLVSFFEGAMIHGVFHDDLHGGNMVVSLSSLV